jgi:tripartite-type tricarboxylate transporter receptor subunit TctC
LVILALIVPPAVIRESVTAMPETVPNSVKGAFMSLSCFGTRVILIGMLVAIAGAGFCQDYPNKPIRIVTTTIGGGNDFTSRLIAQGMSGAFGQQLIVDNRGGVLAADILAKAPPDGYTLGVNDGSLWIIPLFVKASYDPVRDFSPISLMTREVNVLTVNPTVPAGTVKELIALAKAKPGELNYGSGPTGGLPHLAVELFKVMASVNIVRIPYAGGGAALVGVMGGQVQMAITSANSVSPHVKSGKLKALAVTSLQPSSLVPGVPTLAAAALPGYEYLSTSGMFGPAKMPAAVVGRINREIAQAVNRPDIKEKFFSAGIEAVSSSPEEFADSIKSERAKVGKLIADAGIKVD